MVGRYEDLVAPAHEVHHPVDIPIFGFQVRTYDDIGPMIVSGYGGKKAALIDGHVCIREEMRQRIEGNPGAVGNVVLPPQLQMAVHLPVPRGAGAQQ